MNYVEVEYVVFFGFDVVVYDGCGYVEVGFYCVFYFGDLFVGVDFFWVDDFVYFGDENFCGGVGCVGEVGVCEVVVDFFVVLVGVVFGVMGFFWCY